MKPLTPDETLLGLLAISARHGYELLDSFHQNHELGRVWNLSSSQIYAVLKRLQNQDWIEGHEIVSENAPPRTEYRLTASGEARLHAWLDEPHPSASIRRIRVEFLSRLFIARQLGISVAVIVQRQRDTCKTKYAELLNDHAAAEPGIDRLALELHIAQLRAVLQWIDRCEQSSNLAHPIHGDYQK